MALCSKSRKLAMLFPSAALRHLGESFRNYQFSASVLQEKSGVPKPQPVPMRKLKDSFLYGTSSSYLEELEQRYQTDPKSVDKTWAAFFQNLENGVKPEAVAEAYHAFERGEIISPLSSASLQNQTIQESMKLMTLVRAYQMYGHFEAKLDPLGLNKKPKIEELTPEFYGFIKSDLDRDFSLGTVGLEGFLGVNRPVVTLREIIARLNEVYCGTIGYEYMHIPNREKCNWLCDRLELLQEVPLSKERKLHTLDRLAWSDMFETFCSNKFTAAKRFGLEGCTSLIPGMKAAIDKAADFGLETVVIGMPHRGRLNVLTNVVRKPMSAIFAEFFGTRPSEENSEDENTFYGGDVKYHLGTSYDRPSLKGKMLHLALVANPSHLEAVDPVVAGKTRAKQHYENDRDRIKNMPILLHGDGSFAGQGIVYETFHMSELPDYTVGGTLHIIVNNQVAFTTDPYKSRSSPYCTDVAKAINAPVFHVNGDDVEAVIKVCELAAEWRQTWKSDVVVDIVCYRKHGHNEIDNPMFTQPLMYKVIKKKEKDNNNAFSLYQKKLIAEGVITKDEIDQLMHKVRTIMSREYEDAEKYKLAAQDWLSSRWKGFMSPEQLSRIRNTGVKLDILQEVGNEITKLPSNLNLHPEIKKIYDARQQMINQSNMMGQLDWAMAEALAFGTLLKEGNHVRLSGQDVERGTFSHRHAVIHDQENGQIYIPLANISSNKNPHHFAISNSPLSEFGVLGFELGYSLENPNSLILWEAQFGDFANGAQVIFDQFLSSGETKWLRQSGLVVLLPHGYDGQGPEHSSARIERFLQMCNDDPYKLPKVDEKEWFTGGQLGSQIQHTNWQIVNCTTPANYFHVLRRQIHRQFRKPLIVFTPKNLLKHPDCKSYLWEFDDIPDDAGIEGVRFKRLVMDEKGIIPKSRAPYPPVESEFKRIVFCSGKIFFELQAARNKLNINDIALIRIEQLSPFPFDLVCRELRRYPEADIVWCQEEPQNMGAYHYIQPRMHSCLRNEGKKVEGPLPYIGRKASASPATGFLKVHQEEQNNILLKALKQ